MMAKPMKSLELHYDDTVFNNNKELYDMMQNNKHQSFLKKKPFG